MLEERNRLAGEIHDALAQSFTAISMQLEVAQEEMAANEGDPRRYIRQAGMRERAAQIDAKLDIQTAAGHGTSIIVTVPIL